jgi:hypothetical protein
MEALLRSLNGAAKPHRLRILAFCARRRLTVGVLAGILGADHLDTGGTSQA